MGYRLSSLKHSVSSKGKIMPKNQILLNGPVGVCKTTVASVLTEKMGSSRVSMDDILVDCMAEVGH